MSNKSNGIVGYTDNSQSINSNLWHKCIICNKIYTKRSNLKRHIKGTHQQQLHHCSKCDTSYKRKDYFVKHMKTCHPLNPSAATEPVDTPIFYTSVGSQTKKCRLHRSKTLTHTLSGPDRPTRMTDQGTSTGSVTPEVSYQDRACSPITWGNVTTPVTKPVANSLEEYFTANSASQPVTSVPQDLQIPSVLIVHKATTLSIWTA